MDPLEQKIRQMFPRLLQEYLMSFSNMTVPQHRHNGVDSPQISSNNIDTSNPQGFIFGTGTNNVNIQYDVASNTFVFLEGQTPSTVPLEIGTFKSISVLADGTGARIQYTGPSGNFVVGETITGGTSGATGVITGLISNTSLEVVSITGTFQVAETITGGTTGSTATVSVITLDNIELFFDDGTKASTARLNKSSVLFNYTAAGSATDFSTIILDTSQNTTTVKGSGDTSFGILTPTLMQYLATGDFALQLPDTTRPAVPSAGMIAFEAGQFYYCTVAGVWTPF